MTACANPLPISLRIHISLASAYNYFGRQLLQRTYTGTADHFHMGCVLFDSCRICSFCFLKSGDWWHVWEHYLELDVLADCLYRDKFVSIMI
jgi:hypothetical protein